MGPEVTPPTSQCCPLDWVPVKPSTMLIIVASSASLAAKGVWVRLARNKSLSTRSGTGASEPWNHLLLLLCLGMQSFVLRSQSGLAQIEVFGAFYLLCLHVKKGLHPVQQAKSRICAPPGTHGSGHAPRRPHPPPCGPAPDHIPPAGLALRQAGSGGRVAQGRRLDSGT